MKDKVDNRSEPWHCGARRVCPKCIFSNLLTAVFRVEGSQALMHQLTRNSFPMSVGQTLRREGEPFQGLIMIRGGVLKTFMISEDGGEQIIDFHFPGELIGLSAMGTGTHMGCTIALSVADVCLIRAEELEELCNTYPDVRRRLLELTAREVARREHLHQSLSGTRAECRLAMALLNIAERLGVAAGEGALSFQLPMARVDLAAYLGLTPETTSRQLRRWESYGWLKTRGRDFTIREPDVFHALASRHSSDEDGVQQLVRGDSACQWSPGAELTTGELAVNRRQRRYQV